MVLSSTTKLKNTILEPTFKNLIHLLCLPISLVMVYRMKLSLVPMPFCKDLQKWVVNWLPWFETISLDIPHNFIISLMFIFFSSSNILVHLTGMKWPYLATLTTITYIESCHRWVRDNHPMKFIGIISHFHSGISRSWSKPPSFVCSNLIC